MTTLDDLAADFVLRHMTGDPRPEQHDIRTLVGTVFSHKLNYVVEDEGLGFSLLLALNTFSIPGEPSNPLKRHHVLWTPYTHQKRRPLTQQDVLYELTNLGVEDPTGYVAGMAPSQTIVVQWRDEVCLAFQRLHQTGRWAKRSYPLGYSTVIPLMEFISGVLTGMHTAVATPGPPGPVQYPLPYLTTT
ncbi:MAG TPA: hypothetical protein VJM32_06610 [Candidatus Saccharimonadales bacterium]|nr:hypothetical protein [Candidatus Saccharimonadales bacterium]